MYIYIYIKIYQTIVKSFFRLKLAIYIAVPFAVTSMREIKQMLQSKCQEVCKLQWCCNKAQVGPLS